MFGFVLEQCQACNMNSYYQKKENKDKEEATLDKGSETNNSDQIDKVECQKFNKNVNRFQAFSDMHDRETKTWTKSDHLQKYGYRKYQRNFACQKDAKIVRKTNKNHCDCMHCNIKHNKGDLERIKKRRERYQYIKEELEDERYFH